MYEDDPEMSTWVAVGYHILHQPEAAREYYDRALERFGDSTTLYLLAAAGNFFAEQGDLPRARAIWSTGEADARAKVERQPDNPNLKAHWASLQGLMGRVEEMMALRDEVKKNAPTTMSLAFLGMTYLALGYEQEGMEMLMELEAEGAFQVSSVLITARAWGVREISGVPGYQRLKGRIAENQRQLAALY